MKYSELVKPLGIRSDEAGAMIGNLSLFERMIRAGWIRPVVNRHSCKLFDVTDVEQCWKRLKAGDYPVETAEVSA
ncbi:MAG: hypothetical protein IT578_05010 [Verrucomicrobiae bacterium]|nr:hypothetical protein [Verrucomicrobiae bacterium]